MSLSLLKSILHNIGVVIVGLGFAYLGTRVDLLLGIKRFHSFLTTTAGWLLVIIGFLLRVWATFHFYQQRMKVISLAPQRALITSRSEEHTSELQSRQYLVCRLLLEK